MLLTIISNKASVSQMVLIYLTSPLIVSYRSLISSLSYWCLSPHLLEKISSLVLISFSNQSSRDETLKSNNESVIIIWRGHIILIMFYISLLCFMAFSAWAKAPWRIFFGWSCWRRSLSRKRVERSNKRNGCRSWKAAEIISSIEEKRWKGPNILRGNHILPSALSAFYHPNTHLLVQTVVMAFT